MDSSMQIGEVVLSLKGRDCDRCYVVVEIVSSEYVKIADGEKHVLEKTKLKKIKHLRKTNDRLDSIGDKLIENKQVFDSEIRSALRSYNTK